MSGVGTGTSDAAAQAAPSRLRRVLPHGVMLAASVFLYWSATRIDAYTGGGARLGPDAWPKAIIVFLGLLCAYEVVRRLLARSGAAVVPGAPVAEALVPVAQEPAPAPREHPRMLAGGVALIAGYVVLVPWIGFFVATAVFLAAFPWIGGLRRPLLASALGIAGSFLLVVLFMRVAYISLPLGEGPFRALSLGLLGLIGVK